MCVHQVLCYARAGSVTSCASPLLTGPPSPCPWWPRAGAPPLSVSPLSWQGWTLDLTSPTGPAATSSTSPTTAAACRPSPGPQKASLPPRRREQRLHMLPVTHWTWGRRRRWEELGLLSCYVHMHTELRTSPFTPMSPPQSVTASGRVELPVFCVTPDKIVLCPNQSQMITVEGHCQRWPCRSPHIYL